ncbi:MAG TPA: acyl transferase [Bacteroidia bacterium]|jgi:phenylacetate-coenzyme A ligase PaaK-like adenylate-forming protein|nr:acyl transferase [Bacteroidia bacterium]
MDKDVLDKQRLIEGRIFKNLSDSDFEKLALEIFHFQVENTKVYNQYVNTLGVDISKITRLNEIPFLPISIFKSHAVVSGAVDKNGVIFKSSTTTSGIPSKHIVKDVSIYKTSFRKGFERFYGDIKGYCLLALLPSYLERGDSSLVYMVDELIKNTQNPGSGFYMNNYDELMVKLKENEAKGQKTLLIGVTYALLKLAEECPMELKNTVIMETGGMKGRREELTRPEVHKKLADSFQLMADSIHSEYGMTELLSQAYSHGKGVFECVPWMKVLVRDIYDPFEIVVSGQWSVDSQKGAINIIDLANINSCSFIATEDVGISFPDGKFEVSGRLDISDIRGCNLMAL